MKVTVKTAVLTKFVSIVWVSGFSKSVKYIKMDLNAKFTTAIKTPTTVDDCFDLFSKSLNS